MTNITREQARDMAEAHAEGMHAGLSREGCPECEERPLREYPPILPPDPGYYVPCGQTDPA